MPCVCQHKCGEKNNKPSMQPYRDGLRFCAVCKVFQIPNTSNKCFCCNGKLRTKTRSNPPEQRKKRIWQWIN